MAVDLAWGVSSRLVAGCEAAFDILEFNAESVSGYPEDDQR